MPTVPQQTKCGFLGCGNKRSPLNSFCIEHGGKTFNDTDKRKQSNAKYSTAVWQRIRTAQLSRQPLCQACMGRGRVNQATVVDHVFPWGKIGAEAFLMNLFQSLCPECHSVKTGLEQTGVFRHYKEPSVDYTLENWRTATQAE